MPLENNTSTSTAANLPIYMVRLEQISEIKDQERILLGRLLALTKGGENARWKDEEMADRFLSKVKSFVTENRDRPFFL